MSVTTSAAELRSLVPLLRELYYSGRVDGLSLVATSAEASLQANPWVHRRLHEYLVPLCPLDRPLEPQDMAAGVRRAVLEERPDVVLFGSPSALRSALLPLLAETGIGEYVVRPEAPWTRSLDEIRNRHLASQPRAGEGLDPGSLLDPHWQRLGDWLRQLQGPCWLRGHQRLMAAVQARFPDLELRSDPPAERVPGGLALLALSLSEKPEVELSLLDRYCGSVLLLEPLNTQVVGGRYTLRYGDYDNEFAFLPAELDLRAVLPTPHRVEVWGGRSGRAGLKALPAPDGRTPLLAITLGQAEPEWTERYRLPEGTRLKIVFADSGNVAGSVLHHTAAVNRYTDSQAWALSLAPHPMIGTQGEDDHTFFVQGQRQPSPRLEQVLRQADCFVFFEDDDEASPSWPFALTPYVEGKGVVHLYIGYRAHKREPRMERPGRRILTPLPHLLRLYPQASFYAGFPPLQLLDIPLAPPRSAEDGVCRLLHTPSLPHWTTARYPYHKDTETFLRVARRLKQRFGSALEIHQVAGWSQEEVLKARQVCDITFNQLRGFHGLSGDEAMLLERPCVQAFDRSNIARHREYWGFEADFPWVSATPETLEEVLAELIQDAPLRQEIGRRSRAFMLKYFSPQKGILPLLFHCYQAVGTATENTAS